MRRLFAATLFGLAALAFDGTGSQALARPGGYAPPHYVPVHEYSRYGYDYRPRYYAPLPPRHHHYRPYEYGYR